MCLGQALQWSRAPEPGRGGTDGETGLWEGSPRGLGYRVNMLGYQEALDLGLQMEAFLRMTEGSLILEPQSTWPDSRKGPQRTEDGPRAALTPRRGGGDTPHPLLSLLCKSLLQVCPLLSPPHCGFCLPGRPWRPCPESALATGEDALAFW